MSGGPGVVLPAAARAQHDHVAALARQQVAALVLIGERSSEAAVVERVHLRAHRLAGKLGAPDELGSGAEPLQLDAETRRLFLGSELQMS